MPNVITHGLLAQQTLKLLPVSVVKDAIAKYPQAYLFGSNGPDFLFYYLLFNRHFFILLSFNRKVRYVYAKLAKHKTLF